MSASGSFSGAVGLLLATNDEVASMLLSDKNCHSPSQIPGRQRPLHARLRHDGRVVRFGMLVEVPSVLNLFVCLPFHLIVHSFHHICASCSVSRLPAASALNIHFCLLHGFTAGRCSRAVCARRRIWCWKGRISTAAGSRSDLLNVSNFSVLRRVVFGSHFRLVVLYSAVADAHERCGDGRCSLQGDSHP